MKVKRKADEGLTARTTAVWLLGRMITMVKILCSVGQYLWSVAAIFIMGPLRRFVQSTRHMLWLLHTTGDRDLKALKAFLRAKYLIRKCRNKELTVPRLFELNVDKHPDKLCIVTHEKQWTFRQVDEYANRVCNCFSELGFLPGDEVIVLMENCPENTSTVLGLAKMGVVPALVNTNQKQKQLIHSITAINAKAIIVGTDLLQAIWEVYDELREKVNVPIFCVGDFESSSTIPTQSLDLLLKEASPERPVNKHKVKVTERLFYIYTSGTTGLPKAAIITHLRFTWMGSAINFMMGMTDEDVVYTCLPLYHSAAGILAISQCLIFGLTIAMRKKFSASNFFLDCKLFNVTVTHYIGEICRYLVLQPEKPSDKEHSVRIMFGNGLRPQIWKEFVERFNIKQIGELYGSTEGNTNVINVDSKPGSVGFISQIAPSVYPVALIKVDLTTGDPIRGPDGFCITCGPGEPGEFVGKIHNNDPLRAFDGYVNKSASQKKIIKDVFRKGECAFLSGDLLIMDKKGYLYFLDRTGDTFRWKGENVSTSEIESIVGQYIGMADCVVYGVQIPGTEGRAGMAALATQPDQVDLPKLVKDLKAALPSYSIPIFIRFIKEFEATGTYKLKKVDLQKEGYDINLVSDPVYYLNAKEATYVPVDKETYQGIINEKMRF